MAELASRLNVTLAEAVGLCTLTWAAIAEHRPDGDLSGIGISALEKWGEWEPRKGKTTGAFGTAFRDLFLTDDAASGWRGRQGKLVERAEKDRARKLHGTSTESRRDSAVTERNGTKPTTKAPANRGGWVARFGVPYSEASGGIAPHGEIGKHLKPLVDRDGEDPTYARWANFCASDKRQFGAAYFAKNAGDFDQARKATLVALSQEERAAKQFKQRGYI